MLGVICGLAAAVWLAGAEAPTKLVTSGLSPFVISLSMVAGVFVARWTLPIVLKGTGYVFFDLREKPHLVVWAIMAGALWAVGNTLTVFAVRDVGLSIAFPLWNTNSLVGVFWGWFFFRELRGAGMKTWGRVVGGAVGIVFGAVLLGFASSHETGTAARHSLTGILAALGAGLMFGTMYIPYRKAYLSGMNPLSFVTVFTVGELGTITALAASFRGGIAPLSADLHAARPVLFWLFLGGFCWVVGDLFQQYAAKYIGIGRGIPLSNTNQLWGLVWGAVVFGELGGTGRSTQLLVIFGSVVMVAGAVAISTAVAPAGEQASCRDAIARECDRYGLDRGRTFAAQMGEDPMAERPGGRRWWDVLIVAAAVGAFIWLAKGTVHPPIAMNAPWAFALILVMLVFLIAGGWFLWNRTRFS